MVIWIEWTYHRKRRQRRLGKRTLIETELHHPETRAAVPRVFTRHNHRNSSPAVSMPMVFVLSPEQGIHFAILVPA